MKDSPQESVDFYKTSKFDLFLIALVLFFSIFSVFWMRHRRAEEPQGARIALIYQNNTFSEQVELAKDKTIELLGGKMKIETKAGKIRVVKSDCPQALCVNMGWIGNSGQALVCVPNKVLVEIKSTAAPLLDAVAY